MIRQVQRNNAGVLCAARVTWSYKQICETGGVRASASQGVLASARAKNQNVHKIIPSLLVHQRCPAGGSKSRTIPVTMHNAGIFEGLLVFGRTDVALMAKFEFRAGPLHDAFRDNASGQQMGRLDQPSGMAPSTGERPVRLLRAADLQSAWRILRSG